MYETGISHVKVIWTFKYDDNRNLGSAEPVPHENEELDDENRKILLPTPYVKVDIGNGILPIVEETQAVIFIFG
jgi:hypothetical protein